VTSSSAEGAESQRDVRAALVEVGEEAAAETPGVAQLDSRRTGVGVSCVVVPEGGYELMLRVVADPVPLEELAGGLRERVVRAAEAASLADELRSVTVVIDDLSTAELPA
jgi:hypothetical protein